MNHGHGSSRTIRSGILAGIIIVMVGTILLLDQMDIFPAWRVWRFWPLVLVALGAVRATQPGSSAGRIWGGFVAIAGVMLLLNNLGHWHYGFSTIWPLAVIAIGFLLIVRAIEKQNPGGPPGSSDSLLKECAIFGGGDRRITSQDFRGGEILAIFGGLELDLTRAQIAGDEAVIHVDSMFGGAEIRVPYEWDVVPRGTAIFGGFSDQTAHPKPGTEPPPKRLVVNGSAVFGGVEIKN